MYPKRRSLGIGMAHGLHNPQRELFEKRSTYIAKQSNSRPMKVGRNLKKQQREAYKDYVSNLLETTTNPDLPTLGRHFWSFIKSVKKDNVGISPMKENGIGETVHHSILKRISRTYHLPQAFLNIFQLHFDAVEIAKDCKAVK